MKVSLITASFNSEQFIEDTIISVINQTFKNIEYIIIDGKSHDNTINIVNRYKNHIAKIISEKDNGIYDAMNKGIAIASGDIIGFINSDDFYTDNSVIENIVKLFLSSNPDALYADIFYISRKNKNKIIRHWTTDKYQPNSMTKGWHPPHPTLFVKKDIYNKYGGFNTKYSLAADFELMLRLFEKYKISSVYYPKPIIKMRTGGATSKNISNIIKQNIECLNAFKDNNIEVSPFYPVTRLYSKFIQLLKTSTQNNPINKQ